MSFSKSQAIFFSNFASLFIAMKDNFDLNLNFVKNSYWFDKFAIEW